MPDQLKTDACLRSHKTHKTTMSGDTFTACTTELTIVLNIIGILKYWFDTAPFYSNFV